MIKNEVGYGITPVEVENIPVIKCIHERNSLYKFYCDLCKRNHYHGPKPGHRIAHCHNEDSPFDKTGYFVIPMTEAEVRAYKRARKRRTVFLKTEKKILESKEQRREKAIV
jgi:hypothetical protein